MIPFMWSFGSIFGAALGGYLARPADTWPARFPKNSIFSRYPYLLPNFIAAVFIIFAILVSVVFLKETNIHRKPVLSARLDVSDERTPLVSGSTHEEEVDQDKPRERRTSTTGMPGLTAGTTIDIRRLSTGTAADSIRPRVSSGDLHTAIEEAIDEEEEAPKHEYSRAMILLIMQLFLMSYHQMGFASLMPVFLLDGPTDNASSDSRLDLHGGLGYTVRDVGQFMAGLSVASMVIQIFILPPFIARIGMWKSFVWMTILCPLVYVFAPFLTDLPRPQTPIGVYATMVLNSFTVLIIYPCLLIALKNATPSMGMLGSVNGLAMAGCSGARTISPPAAGFVYSKAGSAAAFWSVGAAAVMAAMLILFMKPPAASPPPATDEASTPND